MCSAWEEPPRSPGGAGCGGGATAPHGADAGQDGSGHRQQSVNDLPHAGHVVDQPGALPHGEHAVLRVAGDVALLGLGPRHHRQRLLEPGLGLVQLHRLEGGGVFQIPGLIADAALADDGVALSRAHNGVLEILVDDALLGGHKPGAHGDALRPQGQGGGQAPAVGHPAGGDDGYVQRPGGGVGQDKGAHHIQARVSGALPAVHDDRVHPQLLGGERVLDGHALVHHLDARPLERGHIGLGAAPGGLRQGDAVLVAGVDVLEGLVPLGQVRHKGEVHREGLIGQVPHLLQRVLKGGQLGVDGDVDGAQPAGVGHRGGQRGNAQVLHSALHDGVLDSGQLGKSGFEHGKDSFLIMNWVRACSKIVNIPNRRVFFHHTALI